MADRSPISPEDALKLLRALKATLPDVPSSNAICHVGICAQSACSHCSRLIHAHQLVNRIEQRP